MKAKSFFPLCASFVISKVFQSLQVSTLLLAVALILAGGLGPWVHAMKVTIDSLTEVEDTTLYSNNTSDNAGGGLSNRAGRTESDGNRRLLVRFDVSSIPSSSNIDAATL